MAYQYTNKNGETFGITHTKNSTIAYINGSYVAQTEEVLNHFSHTDIKRTLDYTGITRD